MITKAIILAAGSGTRLKKHHKLPKCLLSFGTNKITIIERLYKILIKKNISDIVVVVGYKKNHIKKILGRKVKYIYFPNYKKANNLQSLLAAKKEINDELKSYLSGLVPLQELLMLRK